MGKRCHIKARSYSQDTEPGWDELLMEYNGQAIDYDNIGNPVSVTDAQGNLVKTYSWTKGRQMATHMTKGVTWSYTYDADGMRTGRTDGTNTYEYIYAGDKLVRMVKNGEVVDFGYAGGQLATLTYNGTTYYYVLNGQGDVIGLMDNTGKMAIGYIYSAYGIPTPLRTDETLTPILKNLNPFMYRGYVYDIETSLYYLQSRYYDPEMGRFINADALVSTGQGVLGNNMFAYCGNNPVLFADPAGYIPSKNIYPVCIGESLPSPGFIGTTDNDDKSDALLQEIMNGLNSYDIDWYPFCGQKVHVSVTADGVYKNDPNYALDWGLFGVGLAVTFIPGKIPFAIGLGLSMYGGVEIAADMVDPLPNREYYQYSVKMIWTTTESHCGVLIHTTHCIEQIYVWNDTSKHNAYWYMYSQSYTSKSTTIY